MCVIVGLVCTFPGSCCVWHGVLMRGSRRLMGIYTGLLPWVSKTATAKLPNKMRTTHTVLYSELILNCPYRRNERKSQPI